MLAEVLGVLEGLVSGIVVLFEFLEGFGKGLLECGGLGVPSLGKGSDKVGWRFCWLADEKSNIEWYWRDSRF